MIPYNCPGTCCYPVGSDPCALASCQCCTMPCFPAGPPQTLSATLSGGFAKLAGTYTLTWQSGKGGCCFWSSGQLSNPYYSSNVCSGIPDGFMCFSPTFTVVACCAGLDTGGAATFFGGVGCQPFMACESGSCVTDPDIPGDFEIGICDPTNLIFTGCRSPCEPYLLTGTCNPLSVSGEVLEGYCYGMGGEPYNCITGFGSGPLNGNLSVTQ